MNFTVLSAATAVNVLFSLIIKFVPPNVPATAVILMTAAAAAEAILFFMFKFRMIIPSKKF